MVSASADAGLAPRAARAAKRPPYNRRGLSRIPAYGHSKRTTANTDGYAVVLTILATDPGWAKWPTRPARPEDQLLLSSPGVAITALR